MITLKDVLHQIAGDILDKNDNTRYEFNMNITSDVEAAKADFIKRYGQGKTYHFLLENYQHGRQLAAAIYQFISGKQISVPEGDEPEEEKGKALYLLVHLSAANAS